MTALGELLEVAVHDALVAERLRHAHEQPTDTITAETATPEATAVVPQQEPYVPEALGAHRIAALLAHRRGGRRRRRR
ncbi:hypothetical protein ABZ135_37610 [Streptomyces sp. NPDC006339]|uniref:hypothetical protein n=1 Tax=Streptomyces sp. NPDC006339 TaxID=3156755 RepID=UPI0033A07627